MSLRPRSANTLKPRWRALLVVLFTLNVLAGVPAFPVETPDTATQGRRSSEEDEVFRRIERLVSSRRFDEANRLLEDHGTAWKASASSYFRMGKLYFDHQEWSRSASFLQKSLQLADQNDQAHLLLGLACRQLRRADDAETELAAAARLNPASDLNAYMAGHQLLIDGKYEAALGYLYKAVALSPHNAAALRALGMDQARLGNYGLAETYYEKAIEVAGSTPQGSTARIDLAFLLLLGHDPAKLSLALKLAQEVVHSDPSAAEGHYLAGKALFKLGRVTEAIRELLQAEKLNPEDSKPHFLLAQAFDRLGEEQKASDERKAVLRIRQRSSGAGIATGDALPRNSD
jgi:Flp pilus assembly protein TadD